MATSKFTDLALLWPFANELDQTLFVYNFSRTRDYVDLGLPLHDSMAMFTLSTALGHILMDDSMPQFYLVGPENSGDACKDRNRHLIYIGGPIFNKVVDDFLEQCKQRRVVHFPPYGCEKKPRSMTIPDEKPFVTKYYDPEKKKVRTDYGLILLVNNPFADGTRFKALLVGGLHSYGTLAAARFASYPHLSAEIVRRIMANFHVPPHLLGAVEVLVQADVSEDGHLRDPSPSDADDIKRIYVNGQRIPINPYKGDLEFTVESNPPEEENLNRVVTVRRSTGSDEQDAGSHNRLYRFEVSFDGKFDSSQVAAPITKATKLLFISDLHLQSELDSQRKPDGENKDISVPESLRGEFDKYRYSLCDDAKISVEQQGSKWRIDDEGKTYLIREQNNQLSIYLKGSDSLSRGFFDHFSRRSVVVVSPHSDDSVIACGGLIYYLCNRKLWVERGRGVIDIPRVSVLVMTPSARGVGDSYFENYCRHIGLKKSDFDELERPAIRLNESRAEALLLDTNSHWLDLDVAGNAAKSSKRKVVGTLRDILGQTTEDPIFLIPNFGDQHPTHKDVTKLVLEIIRKQGRVDDEPALTQLSNAEIWLYESPWAALDPADINVIIPLDKHAMFAKCQAVSMHQSQVVRTEYSDIARTHSRYNAEVLREMIFGFGEVDHRWDYVEVFSARKWELTDYSD